VIETSHVTKNPQRECITLDRTPSHGPIAGTRNRRHRDPQGIGRKPILPHHRESLPHRSGAQHVPVLSARRRRPLKWLYRH
jgi:hypothetical protein